MRYGRTPIPRSKDYKALFPCVFHPRHSSVLRHPVSGTTGASVPPTGYRIDTETASVRKNAAPVAKRSSRETTRANRKDRRFSPEPHPNEAETIDTRENPSGIFRIEPARRAYRSAKRHGAGLRSAPHDFPALGHLAHTPAPVLHRTDRWEAPHGRSPIPEGTEYGTRPLPRPGTFRHAPEASASCFSPGRKTPCARSVSATNPEKGKAAAHLPGRSPPPRSGRHGTQASLSEATGEKREAAGPKSVRHRKTPEPDRNPRKATVPAQEARGSRRESFFSVSGASRPFFLIF